MHDFLEFTVFSQTHSDSVRRDASECIDALGASERIDALGAGMPVDFSLTLFDRDFDEARACMCALGVCMPGVCSRTLFDNDRSASTDSCVRACALGVCMPVDCSLRLFNDLGEILVFVYALGVLTSCASPLTFVDDDLGV